MPQFTNILESVQDAVNWISFRGRKRKILVPKDQNEDEEMDFKEPKVQRISIEPMEMDFIVSRILRYCDVATLKSARLVSKMWSQEGLKYLIVKSYITFPSPLPTASPLNWNRLWGKQSEETKRQFKSFLTSINTSSVDSPSSSSPSPLHLQISHPASEALELFQQLELKDTVNKNVIGLKYKGGTATSDSSGTVTGELCQLLDKFPNLQTLETSHLDLSPKQQWLENDSSKLWKFYRKLDSLRQIKMDGINLEIKLNLSNGLSPVPVATGRTL